jgi:hypothetical protein
MYRVSLLPSKYTLKKQEARREDRLLLASMLAVSAFLFILMISLVALAALNSEYEVFAMEELAVKESSAALSKYEDLRQNAQSAGELEKEAAGNLPEFFTLFADIAESAPEYISVSSISLTQKLCEITGSTVKYEDVSGWVGILETIDYLTDISCARLSKADGGVSFTLHAAVAPVTP